MRRTRKKHQQTQVSAYDTTLKDLVKQQARDILPILLPGVVYEDTINIELVRPTIRADKAFKVKYEGQDSILALEFESGPDNDMEARLLVYNAILYRDHKLPVISMIVYPFRTKMAESPLCIRVGQKELVTFHFFMLPLFLEDAERYVREHIRCMYPLLPTMRGANLALIRQATEELATFYQEDEVTLSQQIVWLELLLERTDTIAPQEKREIQEQLKVYDSLWNDNPKVQKIRAESKAEGELEGIAKGETKAWQDAVIETITMRFPSLVKPMRQQVRKIQDTNELKQLWKQLSVAPDEATARFILSTYSV